MPINQQVEKVNAALSRMSPQQLMSMLQDKNNPYLYLVTSRLAQLKEMQQPKPPPPQGTVTDHVAQALMQPPMPPQGIAAAMPPGMAMPPQMAPQMPPQMAQMPPQMPPQAMQAGGHVHDYGVASLPYEPRYEEGGIVAFQEGGGLGERGTAGRNIYGVPVSDMNDYLTVSRSFSDPKIESSEDFQKLMATYIAKQKEIEEQTKENVKSSGIAYGREPTKTEPPKTSDSKITMDPREVSDMFKNDMFAVPTLINSGYPGFGATRKELAADLAKYETAAKANATPAMSFEDIAKSRLEAQKANPDFDPDFFKKRKEGYQKDVSELGDRATGELLTKVLPSAFLEMAGTPGGFLKGLTAGAKKGVEGFDTSMQGIREAREKLKDRMLREDEIKQTAAAGQVDAAIQLKAQNESAIRAEQAALAAKLFEARTGMTLKAYEAEVGAAQAQREMEQANLTAATQMKVAQIGLQKNLDDNQNAVLLKTIELQKNNQLTPDAFIKAAIPLMPEIEAQITQEETTQNIKLSPEERKIRVNQLLQGQVAPVMQALQLYNAQNSPPKGIVSIRPAP